MVRGKTQIKRIENATSRQVTFSKRRSGLVKKAFELSVLCDAQIALIIFSSNGKLYEFSSTSSSKILDRYQKSIKDPDVGDQTKENIENEKEEADKLQKTIELVEHNKRRLLGECLDSCSTDELQELEKQLERSLLNIRARKSKMFRDQIDKLKQEEKVLLKENAELQKKCGIEGRPMKLSMNGQQKTSMQQQGAQVETRLFIGLP